MNKLKKFISSQFFTGNTAVYILGLVMLLSMGLYILFGFFRMFTSFIKIPTKSSIDKNKQKYINISDKKQNIDYVVMEQPKYYICSYCGSKYRYFQTNCDNCGANHIDFIKK